MQKAWAILWFGFFIFCAVLFLRIEMERPMEKTHPYTSGAGNISSMIEKLRSNFPTLVTSDIVKQYGIAPQNESSIINALQFIGIIDSDGKPIPENKKMFSLSKDEEFQKEFSKIIENAYKKLFDLYGDKTWTIDDPSLISFFRTNDETSDTIGRRQAKAFQVFAALSGKTELPTTRANRTATGSKKTKKSNSTQPSTLKNDFRKAV